MFKGISATRIRRHGESKSKNDASGQSRTLISNINNSNSNNNAKNSHNTVINRLYYFPPAENVSNRGQLKSILKDLSSTVISEDDDDLVGSIPGTNVHAPGKEVHFIPTPQVLESRSSNSSNGQYSNENGSESVSFNHTGSGRSQSVDYVSSFAGVGYPLPEKITTEEVRKHLPNDAEKYVRIYMSSKLFAHTYVPLWSPSPGIEASPGDWKHHISIGDVGLFNDEGGFDTFFNIFLTKEQNHDRHYAPPDNFVHYDYSVKIELQDISLPVTARTMTVGLEMLPRPEQLTGGLVGLPRDVNATQCSMIYFHSGYRQAVLRAPHLHGIRKYIQQHQESWQRHMAREYSGELQDRPLLIIYSSLRTDACALATGFKPYFLISWDPKVMIQELSEGNHIFHVWQTNNHNIKTKFSPSPSFRAKLDTYIEDMADNLSADGRKELELSHCVAVGALSLQKKGWISSGRSFVMGKGSKSTMTGPSRWRASLPAFFGDSV